MKIYSVSTRCYYAFGALVSQEVAYKIKKLPGVRWVLADSYLDVMNKDYGGEPFIDGKAVPYDSKYHKDWDIFNVTNLKIARHDKKSGENLNLNLSQGPPPNINMGVGGRQQGGGGMANNWQGPSNMGGGMRPNNYQQPQYGGMSYQSGPRPNGYAPNVGGGNSYQHQDVPGRDIPDE